MIDVPSVLATLAQARPVFHSEADFQHALAWEIQKRLPHASVRLERPFVYQGKNRYIDVWVVQDGKLLALELKYKTRALELAVNGEQYKLLNQSAQDIARYDFVKDIWRLEKLLEAHPAGVGYAIVLTNDSSYWSQSRNAASVDADFRLHEGRELKGSLSWKGHAGLGTIRGREAAHELQGRYGLTWQDYSTLDARSYSRFRYVAVKVEPARDLG
jgi:hypothetical protein